MLAENAAEQKLDARMQQHFNEGKRVTTLGQKSDSCAKHFVIPQFNSMSRCQTQKHCFSIIWQCCSINAVNNLPPKASPCVQNKELKL